MRLVVRNALEQAKALVGEGDVHLFAHSQGAAVSTFALLEELTPTDYNVRQLTTVGAAVVLLGRDKWRGGPTSTHPSQNWIDKNERLSLASGWNGPTIGPSGIRSPRDRSPIPAKCVGHVGADAYFPEVATNAYGPEEHAVHNTSQPFLDHSMYFENTVQVVEPTARQLLGPDFLPASPTVQYIENRLAVIDKMSLGINMLAAVAIAAILPGLPGVHWFFDMIVTAVAVAVGWVIGFFPAATHPKPQSPRRVNSVAFIPDDPVTVWSWLAEAALLLAALIFLNQWIAARHPALPRVGSLPRQASHLAGADIDPAPVLRRLGAFVSVFLGILVWAQPPQDGDTGPQDCSSPRRSSSSSSRSTLPFQWS